MGNVARDNTKRPWQLAIDSVEQQVERGSLFMHTALTETAERVTEVETFLYGLVDVLVTRQVINEDALGEAAAAVRDELDQQGNVLASPSRRRPGGTP
jgi:hypothetical protein